MTWVGQDSSDVVYSITPTSITGPQVTTLPIGPFNYPHVGANYAWTFAMRPGSSECVSIRALTPDFAEYTAPTTTCLTTP